MAFSSVDPRATFTTAAGRVRQVSACLEQIIGELLDCENDIVATTTAPSGTVLIRTGGGHIQLEIGHKRPRRRIE